MCEVRSSLSFKNNFWGIFSILLFVNAELVLYTKKHLHEPKQGFDSD